MPSEAMTLADRVPDLSRGEAIGGAPSDPYFVMISRAVAVWVSAPLLPVTVKVNVPRCPFGGTRTDRLDVLVAGFVLKTTVDPEG